VEFLLRTRLDNIATKELNDDMGYKARDGATVEKRITAPQKHDR